MINNKYFQKLALITIVSLAAINITSCSEDEFIIGADLLKEDKISVQFDDEASIKAYTLSQQDDTTSLVQLGLLGNLNDTEFGYSKAGFAVQIRKPMASDFHKYPNAVLDSIKLYLAYYNVSGDSVTTQKVHVHELSGDLDLTEDYKANYNINQILAGELGSADLNYTTVRDTVFDLDSLGNIVMDTIFKKDENGEFLLDSGGNKQVDKIVPSAESTSSNLVISLSNQLGERILSADSVELSNQNNFLQFFKGIYVETEPLAEGGGIFSFALSSSKIRLYYKNEEDDDDETFDFNITENSARFNIFGHNYTGAPIEQFLNNETLEDTVLYVQGMTGTRVKVEVVDINTHWSSLGNISINKAELKFFVYDTLNVPDRLMIRGLDEDGNEMILTDNRVPSSFVGGFYDAKTKSYKFNIPYHIQEIIDGETENNGFVIFSANGKTNPKRVILNNKKNEENSTKLSVTYTNL